RRRVAGGAPGAPRTPARRGGDHRRAARRGRRRPARLPARRAPRRRPAAPPPARRRARGRHPARRPRGAAPRAPPAGARPRRHAVGTEAIGADERAAGALPAAREVGVAFADLVGFTALGEELPPAALGEVAERLGVLAADRAQPPVRLVKTIGDAAMLVSPDPAAL